MSLVNRELHNLRFSNWKLGRQFVADRWEKPLTLGGGVLEVADTQSNVGYLHTRASVLRNHVLVSEGRCFLFVREPAVGGSPSGALALFQLVLPSVSSPERLIRIAGACLYV